MVTLRLGLIGGATYEELYARLTDAARRLEVGITKTVYPDHASLNQSLAMFIRNGDLPFDLISTHVKYAPSQREALLSLDPAMGVPFDSAVLHHCEVGGELVQLPRLTDARLLHVNTRLWPDPVPNTWDAFAVGAQAVAKRTGCYGFGIPGGDSGLFGTFFELLVSAGGTLIDADGKPGMASDAGRWALGLLRDLHRDEVMPTLTPELGFDALSAMFRAGKIAAIGDWPGYFSLHRESGVPLRFERYPVGPAGRRAVYSGSHSFAITTTCRDVDLALAVLEELTSFDAQVAEGRQGAFVPRRDARAAVKSDAVGDPLRQRQFDLMEQTVTTDMLMFPSMARYPEMEERIAPLLVSAIRDEMSIDATLIQADRVIAEVAA